MIGTIKNIKILKILTLLYRQIAKTMFYQLVVTLDRFVGRVVCIIV